MHSESLGQGQGLGDKLVFGITASTLALGDKLVFGISASTLALTPNP